MRQRKPLREYKRGLKEAKSRLNLLTENEYTLSEWRLDYGLGRTFQEADSILYENRQRATSEGRRSERGHKPSGVVTKPASPIPKGQEEGKDYGEAGAKGKATFTKTKSVNTGGAKNLDLQRHKEETGTGEVSRRAEATS